MVAGARRTATWDERERPIEVVLQPTRALDPVGAPDATVDAVERLAAAGATTLSLRFVHHSPAHYVEQMEDNKIFRPDQHYLGEHEVRYVPIDER